MSTVTTQQHYELPGGTLKVTFRTDHPLSDVERDGLDRIAEACRAFQELRRAAHPHLAPAGDPAAEIDEAIWELGGEQGIMAG